MNKSNTTHRTVAEALNELEQTDYQHCKPMHRLVSGENPTLSYDDWVEPMKVTDGEVAVKVVDGMFRWWYVYDGGEIKRVTGSKGVVKDTPPESVAKAQHDLGNCRHTSAKPVLLENVPWDSTES